MQHPHKFQHPLPHTPSVTKMSIESINQSMAADIKTLLAKAERLEAIESELAELKQIVARGATGPSEADKPVKGKKPSAKAEAKAVKAAKASAEADGSAEPKAPSAWNLLVAQTVADMKQNGWESWTDLKGAVWPASRRGPVKEKGGAESEGFVYDGGEKTDGKAPSPALGGMVRASYLKTQADPAALAKAQAYHAKLDEKRSAASASVGDGEKAAPVADAAAPKKAGRKPMTDEAKASAAAKRAATKAVNAAAKEAAPAEAEFTEPAEAAAVTPKKSVLKPRAAPPAPKKVDLRFYSWEHNGKKYITNERGDVVEPEEGCWVGRFNGTIIDESVAEPEDLEGVEMRE